MATANLNYDGIGFSNAKDSIVIVRFLGDLPGGRTLDVEGVVGNVVCAGHVVVKKADGTFAALAVTGKEYADGAAYSAVAEGDAVVGIVKSTITKDNPQASVMTIGQVREAALPFPVTAEIKAALSQIQFI